MANWDKDKPIYLQIKEMICRQIIEGKLTEDGLIPSIRQLSLDYQINPLTVSKAYQCLVEEEIIEKQRGLGMKVLNGAQNKLILSEKNSFLKNEWPKIRSKIEMLDIDPEELLK